MDWKILTKSTFSHFILGASTANLKNEELGLPDSYDSYGSPLLSYSPRNGLE